MKVIVLGAGPAGLAAALDLCKRGAEVIVLERAEGVGGISRTVNYKGYYFDLGGHRFFTKFDEVQRLWEEVLGEDHPRRTTLVAEQDGRIVGFDTACAPTEAVFGGRGEVRWLHVDPAIQGRGVGRRLMSALSRQLADWGYGGCALAVVVGNAPAMLFYERLGGRRAGGFTDPGPLWPSDNIVFVWDELSALIGDGRY